VKIQLWSIGNDGDSIVSSGLDLYKKRLNHYVDFTVTPIRPVRNASALSLPELKRKEAELIIKKINPGDFLVALDGQGTQMDTPAFSVFLDSKLQSGSKSLIFLVGGAFGLHEDILGMAHFVLSLSRLTFPHQFARLIIAEQLYRAFTLLHHEKYHH
jgi:23S rRNA (pseudouridine1915-N3)-methyltransferase